MTTRTAVFLTCAVILCSPLAGLQPEPPTKQLIRVYAETLSLESGVEEPDLGQVLWSKEYELRPEQSITISYRDQVLEKNYSLTLAFAIPDKSRPPSQEVAVRAQWNRPRGSSKERDFLIMGEMGATLFSDPKSGRTVYLRVVPRILWSAGESGSARGGAMLFRAAYLVLNDRVIQRNLALSGEELVLQDRAGPIARISTTPLSEGSPASGEINGARATLEAGWLRLDILSRQSITGRLKEPLYAEIAPGRTADNIDPESVELVAAVHPTGK